MTNLGGFMHACLNRQLGIHDNINFLEMEDKNSHRHPMRLDSWSLDISARASCL